ncbi:MAG: amidohydrolase [Acidimicrobiia bacterium]
MPADFAFVNGAVFVADQARSWARAVAVTGGTISAVGSDRQVLDQVGLDTEVIDLAGRMLAPGFQDAHVHPALGGLQLLRCNLQATSTPEQAAAAIGRYADANPDQAWVRGGGWRYAWYDRGCPSKELLDAIVPDRPAYLGVADGHSAWVNSAALAAAGIDASTPDPADGRIERLADGSPQGTLHEGAMHMLDHVMPANTLTDHQDALLAGQRYLFSHGVTAWQDAWVVPELHAAYRAIVADGRLKAAVRAALWWERGEGMEQIERHLELRSQPEGGYLPGTIKLMLDGVCENFTGALLDPYLDTHGHPTDNHGIDMIDPGALKEIVTRLDALGFQCHFHAIGDAAVRNALDAIEAARVANDWSDNRHHIAHIQLIDPADLPRFRRLGVTANAQPLWACNEDSVVELTNPFIGPERVPRMYPFGDLLRHGATLAMGSDWSVSTADVMAQISVAVERLIPEDRPSEPFLPEQRMTLTDGLMAFTAGSAYVNHLEADRGTLRPGSVADLVVLDANPFERTGRLWEVGVALTMVGGNVVHRV